MVGGHTCAFGSSALPGLAEILCRDDASTPASERRVRDPGDIHVGGGIQVGVGWAGELNLAASVDADLIEATFRVGLDDRIAVRRPGELGLFASKRRIGRHAAVVSPVGVDHVDAALIRAAGLLAPNQMRYGRAVNGLDHPVALHRSANGHCKPSRPQYQPTAVHTLVDTHDTAPK